MSRCDGGAAIPGQGLCPLESLRRRSEFQFVYDHGMRCVTPFVVVHARLRKDANPARLGLTVSRRCGKACVRTGIRRRVREMLRIESSRVHAGWDIVLTARKPASDASFVQIRRQLFRCLSRLGVVT